MHPSNENSDTEDQGSPSRQRKRSTSRRGRRKSPTRRGLALVVEPERLGICRLDPETRIPTWVHRSSFFSVSRSREELSIVCEETLVPKSIRCEAGWRAIKVKEPLDPTLIGVLASLANPLTKAGVSIFSISTYDTDYLLVRQKKLQVAKDVLEAAGHRFDEAASSAEATISKDGTASRQEAEPEQETLESRPKPKAKKRPSRSEESSETDRESSSDSKPQRTRRTRRTRGSARGEKPKEQGAEPESATASLSTASDTSAGTDVRKLAVAALDERAKGKASSLDTASLPVDVKPTSESGEQVVAGDATAEFRDGATRRKSLRSAERQQRVSEALRRFGAALTQDPRFGDPESAPQPGTPAEEETATGAKDVATEDVGDSKAAVAEDIDTEELDLDWESELVAKEAAKSSTGAFVASSSGAFQGESLTVRSEEDDDDEMVIADGLFTGAIPQNEVEVTDQSFATLGLSDAILEAVRQMGFEHPTPIQAAVVPEALEGVDIIGLAETGSGKTAAFVLPLAERLHHGKGIRGLILCPTREIALQTKAFIDSFGKNHKLRAVAVIGGVKMQPQIDRIRSKPDIVVATPGRLADHLRRRNIDLRHLEELVIDEADHMLDLGFLPQIKEILEQVPTQRRSMMFSATMLPPIERLAQQFMKEPLTIDIRPVNKVAEGIEHRLYLVHDADLKMCLLKLLDEVQGSTLIFARRKLHTEWLARQLQQAGCPSDRIHSDRTQAQRVRALRGFREGKFRILVATDVAARGIDVPRIQHVINYGMPESVEDYVHRAGRTARGNSVGIVSSIGTWQDKAMVRQLETSLGIEMPRCSVEGVEPYVELRPRRKTVRRRRLL